jgi:rhodanese-related sulfurtransferase
MKKIIPEIFWIVVVSAAMGITYNILTDGLPWIYTPPPPPVAKPMSNEQMFGNGSKKDTTITEIYPINVVPIDTVEKVDIAIIDTQKIVLDLPLEEPETKEPEAPTEDPQEQNPTEHGNEFNSITYEQVLIALERDDWIFVDARSPKDYEKGKIGNAVNIDPLGEEFIVMQKIGDIIDSQKKVIIYCNGVDCDLGHEVLEFFVDYGYKEVYIYVGGWDDWVEKGNS